jgi:chromosome condensin MukBEF ATPase and DNA-binding subunit MukB
MSTIAKVFTVLNLVFALIMVGSVASILSKTEDFRVKADDLAAELAKTRTEMQGEIDRATGDRDNFSTQNKTLSNQKADLESELQTAKATLEQVRTDNTQLRNSVDSINASLATVKTELADVHARNKALMDQNDQYRQTTAGAEKDKLDAQDDRARIEGDLKRANDDIAEKERQLAELSAARDNLDAQMKALVAAGVDVANIIGNAVPSLEGKVSMVGPGFVVLSIGENEGVKVGYPFHVYRGGDYIGRVIVDKVLPDSATARINMTNQGASFQAMDSATTRL